MPKITSTTNKEPVHVDLKQPSNKSKQRLGNLEGSEKPSPRKGSMEVVGEARHNNRNKKNQKRYVQVDIKILSKDGIWKEHLASNQKLNLKNTWKNKLKVIYRNFKFFVLYIQIILRIPIQVFYLLEDYQLNYSGVTNILILSKK